MHCKNCGKEIDNKAEICVGCGVRVGTPKTESVGVAKKLGKIGIPGFRSGKKWKMFIATFGYFLIFVALLAAISGPANNYEQPKKAPNQKIDNPAPIYTIAPTVTPVPTKNVLVQYNVETADRFVDYVSGEETKYTYPKEGNKFIVLIVKVTNYGPKTVKTDWPSWYVSVSTTDNPNAFIDVDKVIPAINNERAGMMYPSAELETGGFITGQIPFEVPANFNDYKIKYSGFDRDINIEWQKDSTLSKPIAQ